MRTCWIASARCARTSDACSKRAARSTRRAANTRRCSKATSISPARSRQARVDVPKSATRTTTSRNSPRRKASSRRPFANTSPIATSRRISIELDPSNNARREDLVASEAFLGRVLLPVRRDGSCRTHLARRDGRYREPPAHRSERDRLAGARPATTAGCSGRSRACAAMRAMPSTAMRSPSRRLSKLVQRIRQTSAGSASSPKAELENARRLLALGETASAKRAPSRLLERAIERSRSPAPRTT